MIPERDQNDSRNSLASGVSRLRARRLPGAARLLGFVVMNLVVGPAFATTANASQCNGITQASIKISIRQAPLSVGMDFTLNELNRLSIPFAQDLRHPVLGFYKSDVGYVIRNIQTRTVAVQPGNKPCSGVNIHAELVATRRQIEIGDDLRSNPCLLRAALAHYRAHADAASLALKHLADRLPRILHRDLERYLAHHPVQPGAESRQLRDYVSALFGQAVDAYSASLRAIQASVDTPQAAEALSARCREA